MKKIISVFGSSQPSENDNEYILAYELGKELARQGFDVCNGGYRGIMEAVSKGAVSEGASAIGVTLSATWKSSPNKFITKEIKTNSLFERLENLLNLSSGYVILNGGTGTLVELALVWEFINKRLMPRKPVVCLGEMWKDIIDQMNKRMEFENRETDLIKITSTIEDTVNYFINELK